MIAVVCFVSELLRIVNPAVNQYFLISRYIIRSSFGERMGSSLAGKSDA
ncbi:hypothetical protein SCG7086_BR_00080 [Chlamydiales bacterium SCGC AG-110-P3]|nr:hypothetical protein SCG7086_BR_00080 [Chlamydiales bacterium SCGC AG-110-P3]